MDWKLGGLIGIVCFSLFSADSAAQDAPFCVVSQMGSQTCQYHTLAACQQAAAARNGACAANTERRRSNFYDVNAAIDRPNMAESFQRGQLDGLAARKQQEEIALLQAQRKALQSQPALGRRPETNIGYWVMYKCPAADGSLQLSGVPAPGCIVESVSAY